MKFHKINSYFIDNVRYKCLTGKICCLLNACFLFDAGVKAKVCRYTLSGQWLIMGHS
jgi:hypothetical protein